MVDTNIRTRWNVGLFLLPVRNQIERLGKKFIRGAKSINRISGQTHTRRCCQSKGDGRATSVVSKRTKLKSLILDKKKKEKIEWWKEEKWMDDDIMSTSYWMNRELRCKR